MDPGETVWPQSLLRFGRCTLGCLFTHRRHWGHSSLHPKRDLLTLPTWALPAPAGSHKHHWWTRQAKTDIQDERDRESLGSACWSSTATKEASVIVIINTWGSGN